MKKITLLFAFLLAFASQGYSQFSESFEAGIPPSWTVINNGDVNTWESLPPNFPTVTILKMAKMPFIPDPRYSATDEKRYQTQGQMREDVSMTHRAPYPQEHEINLPRSKMIPDDSQI